MYDPDSMRNPVCGECSIDLMDEHLIYMNHAIWADEINDYHARVLRARYYGEISYIDHCLGRILDAVEAGGRAEKTLICFFSDHGEHLGDHHAWQKESYFEASARVPLLVSWPDQLPSGQVCNELAALTDLFSMVTTAAGIPELRDGSDILGMLRHTAPARDVVFGFYEVPGSQRFKAMARQGDWKYIFMANGNREQLFNVTEDPQELVQCVVSHPDIVRRLKEILVTEISRREGLKPALDPEGLLRTYTYQERPKRRIRQFDRSRGIQDFLIR
jgi:choline-sulfatase